MVNIAKFYLEFTVDESCGRCTPCRIGNKRLYEILDKITKGQGELDDLVKLNELAHAIKDTSLCGLGQSSPNPVLSTLKYFHDEYEAHVTKKTCPAKVCRDMIKFYINPEKCVGCGICAIACPTKCIIGGPKEPHYVHLADCIKCSSCFDRCSFDAVVMR